MPFTPTNYPGTAGNSFPGVEIDGGTPVATGATAINDSFKALGDYAASRVPFWDNATAFVTDDQVCYDNFLWGAVAGSTGVTPGTDATKWVKLGTGGGGGVTEPANQIVFGTGTGVSSSSNLIYDTANHRLTQTATITTTTAAQRLNATFNNGGADLVAQVSDTTLTAYGSASMLHKWQVNGTTIIGQIRTDGAVSFGVNSSLAWANGVGGILALGSPSTEPTTSPTTGNMAMWFKASTGRVRTMSGTGDTVEDVAYLSDVSATGLSSLAVSTTQTLNPAGKYIKATAPSRSRFRLAVRIAIMR